VSVDASQTAIHEIRQTPGEWLYHYTTLETALVYILPQLRLRLSPFSQMRDPREYKQWFPGAVGFFSDDQEGELMSRIEKASVRLNLLRNEFKLLSFTTDSPNPDEGEYGRGFSRSRLWESYASNGTGICLVLRKNTAVEAITRQLDAAGTSAHGPVVYANGPTHAEIMLHFEEIFGDLDVLAERIATRHLEKLFLTKNTEWESEREYRFVVRTPNAYEYVDVSASVVAMIRGPGSAREAEHALRYFAAELGIGLGFVQWNDNEPMLLGRPLARS